MRRDLTFKTASIAGASDLTILAPIKKGLVPALDAITYKTRVKRVLRLLHTGRTLAHEYEIGRVLSDAVERVGKIHSIRIAVLEPEGKVLLAVTFDGAWESYIRVIWQKVSRLLDLIFCNTEGYKLGWESTYDEWCAWLRSAQAETMFLYSQPNVTNSDVHYLQSIERIHRREPDLDKAARESLKYVVPTAESNADFVRSTGNDKNNAPFFNPYVSVLPSVPAFRQGLKALVGLHRLSDVYLHTIGDGAVLHRAAKELLMEFEKMLASEVFDDAKKDAKEHYADALNWFNNPQDYQRSVPELPFDQDGLVDGGDVQGGILDGYHDVSHSCLLLIAFSGAQGMNKFLESFKPTTDQQQKSSNGEGIFQNLTITLEGLRLAGWNDEEIAALPDEFAQGMDRRQGVLGDLHLNHPRRWRLPALNWTSGFDAGNAAHDATLPRVQLASVHAMIELRGQLGGNPGDAQKMLLAKLKTILGVEDSSSHVFTKGATPLSLQWMHRLANKDSEPVEHFGFQVAESNPEYKKPDETPKYNNQVHIGEVLHGYPNAADHDLPANGAKSDCVKDFLRNGSFLVVRKLRQDVAVLNKVVERASSASGLSPERVLAQMMGRWPATAEFPAGTDVGGQPLVRDIVPTGSNVFNFKSDFDGTTCPFHAHIRRANPRASAEKSEGIGNRPPRIVRRGMSYGPHYEPSTDAEAAKKSLEQERGLMFLAYNASIGEQFEVIQRWISGGNSTGSYSGQSDPFLGVAQPGRPRFFQFLHNGEIQRIELDGSDDMHEEPKPLVRLEWGMYAFAPSVKALGALAKKAASTASAKALEHVEWSTERGEQLIKQLSALEMTLGAEVAKDAWKQALEDPDSAADFEAASIWAAIRSNHGGVLKTPFGVLVATQALADQVLLDVSGNLTAHGYLPRMRDSFGELYLGMDAGRTDRAYEKESAAANEAVHVIGANANATKIAAENVVHEAIDAFVKYAQNGSAETGERYWQATIDVRDIIEKVIAHFCEQWFGLSEKGKYFEKGGIRWLNPVEINMPPRYPGHFMAPSRYVFQPHPSDTVRSMASNHGKVLNSAMTGYLVDFGHGLENSHPLVKAILDKGKELKDLGYAPRTLLGLMMGFVPTTDGLMRRIGMEWLRQGTLWNLRTQLAAADADQKAQSEYSKSFLQAFHNAFLLRAAPELLWRTAKKSHQIGVAGHGVKVNEGDMVVVGQISATHEGLEKGDTGARVYAFGDSRRAGAGQKPTHACPGQYAAMAVIEGFLKGLVSYKNHAVRTGPGPLTFVVEGDAVQPEASWQEVATEFSVTWNWKQTEKFTAGGKPSLDIFAFGDSWVWQYLPVKFIGFVNFTLQLNQQGCDFRTSSTNFPEPGHEYDENHPFVFNYPGLKSSDLINKGLILDERMKSISKQNVVLGAILLSAGGNDIAAHEKDANSNPIYETAELYKMLNDGADSIETVFDVVAKGKFFAQLRTNYMNILKMLLAKTSVPIFMHGYDYPIPDGEFFKFGSKKMGPWLEPVFVLKHIERPVATDAMKQLIDELNSMIKELADNTALFGEHGKTRLRYVPLAGTLSKQAGYNIDQKGYKDFWMNELHPSKRGYEILTKKILEAMEDAHLIT